ncbi:hypothetical protein BS627_04620 [Agrobacterium salinitolerans]|nr:hypothetical protein BS627_04620 [Agrobacterium salinitolerans]
MRDVSGQENPHTLIPVLVTGIQPTRVCAAKRLALSPKDLGWLDSCDKHKNEGRSVPSNHLSNRFAIHE